MCIYQNEHARAFIVNVGYMRATGQAGGRCQRPFDLEILLPVQQHMMKLQARHVENGIVRGKAAYYVDSNGIFASEQPFL